MNIQVGPCRAEASDSDLERGLRVLGGTAQGVSHCWGFGQSGSQDSKFFAEPSDSLTAQLYMQQLEQIS